MISELKQVSNAPAPGWRSELAAHSATRRRNDVAVQALLTRASSWTQTWLRVVTNPRATGQELRDMRDLHRRLGVVLGQIADLTQRDPSIRIDDPDVRAAVQTLLEKRVGKHPV